MRTVLLTIVILVILATCAFAQQADVLSTEDIVNQVKKGVIKVQGIELGGPTIGGWGGGSGFVFEIDYDTGIGYAITNHHVSGTSSVSSVTFWDGAVYKAHIENE